VIVTVIELVVLSRSSSINLHMHCSKKLRCRFWGKKERERRAPTNE
jgi:hypothetical protein